MARLLWFGAVYTCPVVPAPPEKSASITLGSETLASVMASREAGIKRHGKDVSERG